jgi:hypothetical protein
MIRIKSTVTANSYKHTLVHVTSSINKEKVPCRSAPLLAKISLPLGRSHDGVAIRAAFIECDAHSPRADQCTADSFP